MSQEFVDKLRRGYEAFNQGDFNATMGFLHPDVEFLPPGDQPPYRGAESFRAWMEPDAFEAQEVEPLEFTVVGNKVLVEQDTRARGAGSGIELEIHSWAVWSFDEGGRVTRVKIFLDHEETEARRAAGLPG
jgi:ketosteroid isomerase-like protein